MITPSFGLTATERILPRLALDFTTASLDPRITFTRTTDALNPATYINSFGIITAATNNQPRFDYDPVTLVCKGLLIEESRTNLLLNTDLLSTQTVTVTAAVRTLSFYGTGSVTLSGAHTALVSGTGAYPTRTTYSFTPTAGALTLTVAGTVQYAQLEGGAFATSYIPTTATALTRNADVVTMTGTNFSSWFNASEGTLEATGSTYSIIGAYGLCNIGDNTANNRIYISAYNVAQGFITSGGVSQAGFNAATVSSNIVYDYVLAYKTDNFGMAISGNATVTDTSGTVPTVNRMNIGNRYTDNFLNGYIKSINYWPQRLTNPEVQAFSKG